MELLHVSLLGRFSVHSQSIAPTQFSIQKVQELFAYLLIYRHAPHHRESLANLLWQDASIAHSKQYFRKTLWQLQSQLDKLAPGAELVSVEDEWVQINSRATYWLDVAELEEIYHQVYKTPSSEITQPQIKTLDSVVTLCRGELLQGCYHDWCLGERERCQHMYLVLLDKLMDCCLLHGTYIRGIEYGEQILRSDVARERTYRQIMAMYALSGDRTSAIRQFHRCAAVLEKELQVMPAAPTLDLYDQICNGTYPANGSESFSGGIPAGAAPSDAAPGDLIDRLQEVSQFLTEVLSTLDTLQTQVAEQRQTLDAALSHLPDSLSSSHPLST